MKLVWKIIRESIKVLILASILSTIAGIGLEVVKEKLVYLLPLLILLPALNDMIGDFGTIISAKFTLLLFEKKIGKAWWNSKKLAELFKIIAIVAVISAVYIAILASFIASYKGFAFSWIFAFRLAALSLVATSLLVVLMFFISIIGGLIVYKQKKDPDNFLIPLTTSIADLCSVLLIAGLVWIVF